MEKIDKLKNLFKRNNINGYLITKNDEFFGEYVPDNKDKLKYFTNFSGSSGFALILKKKNYLFVDGRYTLQANIQSGKNFKVKNFPKELPYHILGKRNLKIGFNPKLITKNTFNMIFKNKNCKYIPIKEDLVDKVWKRKRYKNYASFYHLSNKSSVLPFKQKLFIILKNLRVKHADYQFITASENIAWLLNIRGKDSKFSPIPNSYLLLDKKKNLYFFCDANKISNSFKKKLKNVKFLDINKTDFILSNIVNKKFIIDKNSCSIFFEQIISKNNKILKSNDPIYDLKSVKSKKELNNIIKAHVYDGAALTKYLFWIKNNYFKKKITEISGERKLLKLRKKNKNFKFLSFPTISGAGPNGAIIHYRAEKETNRRLKKGEIYLVDSGGQYEFGTTDVTRTISLNCNNKKIKNIFTRVLKGHIAVNNFKLKKRTTGAEIDVVARKYLKEVNLDFAHGTGHGVGYFLNVHEGPHAISKNNKVFFKEGMLVSNEPGYYKKNKFGIRTENLIFVKKFKKNLIFDNLTMVPIDKSLIDFSILNEKEKRWLNNYHKKVFSSLKGFMKGKEIIELRKACSAI